MHPTTTSIAPIETYCDEDGWHNRVLDARVPLTHHAEREEAEREGAQMARQRGGGHVVRD